MEEEDEDGQGSLFVPLRSISSTHINQSEIVFLVKYQQEQLKAAGNLLVDFFW